MGIHEETANGVLPISQSMASILLLSINQIVTFGPLLPGKQSVPGAILMMCVCTPTTPTCMHGPETAAGVLSLPVGNGPKVMIWLMQSNRILACVSACPSHHYLIIVPLLLLVP